MSRSGWGLAAKETAIALVGASAMVAGLAWILLAFERGAASRTFRRSCEDDGGMALESVGGLVCADSAIIIAR